MKMQNENSATPAMEIRKKCVRLTSNNTYHFPRSIPRKRSSFVKIATAGVLFTIIAGEIYLDPANIKTLFHVIFFRFILEFIQRFLKMLEESTHLQSRYENSWINMLQKVFTFSPIAYIVFFVATCGVVYFFNSNTLLPRMDSFMFFSWIGAVFFLGNLVEFEASPLHEALWVERNNGLDYGSGMAYSFYHGYLKLVLLKHGNEEKDLKELLQDYEDSNDVAFADYRLFILIPKSLECFVTLNNEFSPSVVEGSRSLEDKTRTVAGVRDRVYRNSVYKIQLKNTTKIQYVCAEYATPLKTFKDVVNQIGEHSGMYKKLKNEIVLQFYVTLKKVLERNNLDHLCELIFYDDENQRFDVGEMIMLRIKELKRLAKKQQ